MKKWSDVFWALVLIFASNGAHAGQAVVTSLLEIRHENVVIQKWDLSCGAAALATILRYQYREPVTEKDIAVALMQRQVYVQHPELIRIRQGFSLLDLKRYTDLTGHSGVAYGNLDLKNLIDMAPVMVPVKVLGYNHFVVFRGVVANRVLLADPAWGNRTMLVTDFIESWIDFPAIGRVGFVVKRRDGSKMPANGLSMRNVDFVMLK